MYFYLKNYLKKMSYYFQVIFSSLNYYIVVFILLKQKEKVTKAGEKKLNLI